MPARWLTAALAALLLGPVATARADVPVVELDGVVHAVSAAHVVQAIDRADAAGAPLVVIRMDTPGGLDSSMRQIVDRMLNCRTPVAVFVGPSGARAASAGFIIAVAADVAAMAPGTNIGAAHPVAGIGQMDEVMSKKVTSDAAAYIRSKAERRGRNVEMAEKAVVESKSFTEKEALELKLIDLVAKDVPDLLAQLEGREVKRFDGTTATLSLAGQKTVDVRMDWRQAILSAIARPEILFLLLLGALAGLGAEISHPGLVFPGVLGALCLILFLFASQIIPVNWAGVLLVVLAIGLFIAEVKVTSYGLLTLGGLVAMILGAMMLVDSPLPELRVDPWSLAPFILAFAAFTIALVRLVLQAQRRRAQTGVEGLLGQRGLAEGDLDPEGWVIVQGERWRARAGERIAGRGGRRGSVGRGAPVAGPKGGVMVSPVAFVLGAFVFWLLLSVKVLNEYERGVIFRLGKVLPQPKGPGLIIVAWPIDRMVRVSLRTVVLDVPPQDVITRDNVTVKVNAVVYFRVMDPLKSVISVENYLYATSQEAQTTLRSILGQAHLDELLSERERLAVRLQEVIDLHTDPWGVKVTQVAVKAVDLPQEMQRAMAKQAESEREKRAKIIHASGELEASKQLAEAASELNSQPVSLHLRYLQTLVEIAAEKNSTIIFPVPVDWMKALMGERKG